MVITFNMKKCVTLKSGKWPSSGPRHHKRISKMNFSKTHF